MKEGRCIRAAAVAGDAEALETHARVHQRICMMDHKHSRARACRVPCLPGKLGSASESSKWGSAAEFLPRDNRAVAKLYEVAAFGPKDNVRLKRFMSSRRGLEALAKSDQKQERKRSSSAVANGSCMVRRLRAGCSGRRIPCSDCLLH